MINQMLRDAVTLEKGLPKNELVPVFKEEVELYMTRFPIIQSLRNENLKMVSM